MLRSSESYIEQFELDVGIAFSQVDFSKNTKKQENTRKTDSISKLKKQENTRKTDSISKHIFKLLIIS